VNGAAAETSGDSSEDVVVAKRLAILVCLTALAACANVNARFDAGQRALSTGAWQPCIDELERFTADADCSRDPRCEQSRIDVAECRLRLGDPTKAFFELEDRRSRVPSGAPLLARIERLENEAQGTLASRMTRAAGEGTLTVRFTSRVHEWIRFDHARFFLDLHPLPTDNHPYDGGTTVLPVPPTSVGAGTHELEVYTVYAGNGSYHGYLAGYRFRARSSQKLVVAAGAPIEVEVRAFDDDPGGPIADSIHLDFVVRTPDAAPPR
jgi:hypothetical protein